MKTKYWILIFAVLLAVCLVSGFFLMQPGQDAAMARIISNGQVLHTVDLYQDRTLEITNGKGRNVVTVKDGKIGVTEANCPDHYCMARGMCAGGTQIVCLPNGLVIEFLAEQTVDAMIG